MVGIRSVAGASSPWLCAGALLAAILTASRGIDDNSPADARSHSRPIVRSPGGSIRALAWSPDGKTLAIAGDGTHVRLWDSDSGATRSVDIGDWTANPMVFSLAWAPDGRSLSVGTRVGSITRWDVATGEPVAARTFGGSDIRDANWSADRRTLAVSLVPDGIEVCDLIEGSSRPLDGYSSRPYGSYRIARIGCDRITSRSDFSRARNHCTRDI